MRSFGSGFSWRWNKGFIRYPAHRLRGLIYAPALPDNEAEDQPVAKDGDEDDGAVQHHDEVVGDTEVLL